MTASLRIPILSSMNSVTVSLPSATIARLAVAVASLQGVRFVGVTYRSKSTNELARHVLIIGASYKEVIRKSMEELTRKLPTLTGIHTQAANELIASYSKSLLAIDTGTERPDYTKAGLYEVICPGLKVSRNDGSFELCGLSHSKTVIEAGVYETVKSRPLTIAKRELEEGLPRSKYRTLALDVGALESVRIGGREIDVS